MLREERGSKRALRSILRTLSSMLLAEHATLHADRSMLLREHG
jgi:hypothetical protein